LYTGEGLSRSLRGILVGTISGSLDIDITGSGGGNPLPIELVAAEALTAASDTGAATATYTGSAVDLSTVASDFTLVGSFSAASLSPSFSLPVWTVEGDYSSLEETVQIGLCSVTLQGSLDGENWYPLTLASSPLVSIDGATIVAGAPTVSTTSSGSPLARYLRAVAEVALTGQYYEYIYPGSWTTDLIASVSATVTAYVGVQL
jgi:hypothetical protein